MSSNIARDMIEKPLMLLVGDCRQTLKTVPDASVQCCVTSPPYFGLRDYGHNEQIGLEPTPDVYVSELVAIFREVRRVLKDNGTLWLNLGDSYASVRDGKATPDSVRGKSVRTLIPKGSAKNRMVSTFAGTSIKPKDLIGIPWRVAFALQADGWWLRQDIIWHKPNPMPESVTDRCTKAHEYIFLLSKSAQYYYDAEAVQEQSESENPAGNKRHKYVDAYEVSNSKEHRTKSGLLAIAGIQWEKRNKRSVWTVATKPYKEAHFATFPSTLITPCILAGAPAGGIVLDPFGGSGTTGATALELGRRAILCEINPTYAQLIEKRTTTTLGLSI